MKQEEGIRDLRLGIRDWATDNLQSPISNLLFILPLLFLGLFYFYPLTAVFRLSFAPEGKLELDALKKLISNSYYARTLWFTTWQAVVSTLLTVALALPSAYVFTHFKFRGKQTLRTMSTLPFVLPTVVVANAFTALLGPSGLLNNLLVDIFGFSQPPIQINHTIWMILLAHVFYNYSIALRIISNFWQNLSPDLAKAAQMLGASPRRAFWHVTLPLLRPAIMAATVLVFIFSFSSFGVVLILGGPKFATIEVEIYRQAVNLFNLPVAAALSLLQIMFTFSLMWFYTGSMARETRPLTLKASRNVERKMGNGRDRLIVGSNLAGMLLLLGAPLLALIMRSFSGKNGLTLQFFRQLFINERNAIFFVPPINAISNSIGFALATVLMAVALGLLSALIISNQLSVFSKQFSVFSKQHVNPQSPISNLQSLIPKLQSLFDPIIMLPLATSAVTLGFGYIIALNKPPLQLRSSLILVPIAHTLVALPFVVRSILPAIRRINPRLREAAALLGADPSRVWREVDWPLIQRALLVGAVFAFTISMGEFGATVFVSRPQTPTMPIAIFRFLGQPGATNYGQALAMSTLLMLVCAVGFIAIERFRSGDVGEF